MTAFPELCREMPVFRKPSVNHVLKQKSSVSTVTHLDVVFEVVVSGLSAAKKISSVEGVVHVPTNARGCTRNVAHPKLLSLQEACMEVAQSEHYGAELSLLGTSL